MSNFTISDFNSTYPTSTRCLHVVFEERYGDLEHCPKCGRTASFYAVSGRKCYACQYCGHQLHPLADTIFHKSSTSLKDWFYAIFMYANSKNGVSAKELERTLGVTYKTAWRMARQIRSLFNEQGKGNGFLTGTVEIDETYVGGKRRDGGKGSQYRNKTAVMGMVERKGRVVTTIVPNTKAKTLLPNIWRNVQMGTRLITDDNRSYWRVRRWNYPHDIINHSRREYVRGDIYTNTIEGFWSQLKRSLHGTYHAVSPKYLQSYVNEFSYRYNRRFSQVPLFLELLEEAVQPS